MKIEKIDKNFSFTQGGCASRPDQSYQELIAKRNNTERKTVGILQ